MLYNIVVGLIGIFAAGVKCTRSACNDIELALNRFLAIVFTGTAEMDHTSVIERPATRPLFSGRNRRNARSPYRRH